MPDFLGIGAMRSGTTWLATHLARHPEIRMGRKEIHFFDEKLPELAAPDSLRDRVDRIRYAARFVRGPLRGGLRGEITPAYAILEPPVIERVAHWMPDVKLIYLMRDPVERDWSQTRRDFPLSPGQSIRHVGRDELVSYLASQPVRRRSDYVACIRNWLEFFPREQFFFGFTDDLRARPGALLRDLFAFLGVDPEAVGAPADLRPVVGSAEPAPMPDWWRDHIETTWPLDTAALAELVGRDIPWAG